MVKAPVWTRPSVLMGCSTIEVVLVTYFMKEIVLTVVVDEARRIDIRAYRRTDDRFVFRLEGSFWISGYCYTDTAARIVGF